MTLASGASVGPYEIIGVLGVGGMGEVYRARDTRLNRVVAVKVLSPPAAASAERRRRFEREARVIASLSHPSICALYDVGRDNDVDYLVMECIEGETLAHRMGRHPLPLPQAIRAAIEIAEALDYAHRKAIIHRDLKPGNIMLTPGGVKLLDFGLAKLLAADDPVPEPDPAIRSAPETLTEEGLVIGTVQYMAPEQLEGAPAGAGTDIFALGAILYEMITGQKAFTGKSRNSLMAAILTETPRPVRELEPFAPAALDAVVRGCLAKDPEHRWQNARDVALQLLEITAAGDKDAEAARRSRAAPRLFFFGGAVLAALAIALVLTRPRAGDERNPVVFSVPPPARAPLDSRPVQNPFAISPDGRRLAFTAPDASGKSILWVRNVATFSPAPLAGTEGAAAPFWSPDSRFLAFFAGGQLKKVDASGGPSIAICDTRGAFFSGSWGENGQILFAQLLDKVIDRVPASGGTPIPILRADAAGREWSVCWPRYLPDARHFLYVGRSELAGETYVRLGDDETGKSSPLLERCSSAEFAPGPSGQAGDLLFVRDGTLFAQHFDAGRRRITGEPRPVVSNVRHHAYTGLGAFSVSRSGALAFQAVSGLSRMLWVGSEGQPLGSPGGPDTYEQLRLSPDGRNVCVSRTNPRTGLRDLWIGDAVKGTLTRLTATGDIFGATWSPLQTELAYASGSLRSAPQLCRVAVEGGPPAVLRPPGGVQTASDWSRDGRFIAYSETHPETQSDIWIDRLRDGKAFAFLESPYDEIEPQFSPDTRWIAFTSNESGAYEIYLAPFPGPGETVRVSTAGGTRPRWRGDGKELFYVSQDNQMMAVPFHGADGNAGAPRPLFAMGPSGWRDYDVAPDGKKFLIIANSGSQPSGSIRVSMNWRDLTPIR